MLAQAAAKLGFNATSTAPEKDSCAFDVVRRFTIADYSDKKALDAFARDCDVITYEFENVPAECAAFLKSRKPVLPDPAVLENTQDRLIEKDFIAAQKIAAAPYAPVHSASQLEAAVAKTRAAGGAEDPHARLRRQGPGDHRQGRRSARRLEDARARALHPRRLHQISSARSRSSRRARTTARSNVSTSPRTTIATTS